MICYTVCLFSGGTEFGYACVILFLFLALCMVSGGTELLNQVAKGQCILVS